MLNLSVVNIVPDTHKDAINQIAELRAQIVPSELLPSLEFLFERLVLDGDAQENWQSALGELGLVVHVDTLEELK